MLRRVMLFVLVLTAGLSVCHGGLTFSPSPTPTVQPPVPVKWDNCGNHICLSISGLAYEPEKHLLYSHENGIMADGILMFMPLEEYVKNRKIDAVSWADFSSAFLTYDSYVESFSCRTDYFRKTGDKLEMVEEKDLLPSDLSEETCLVRMDCSATHQGKSYRFFYLFWLGSGLSPTPTPLIITPAPSPVF